MISLPCAHSLQRNKINRLLLYVIRREIASSFFGFPTNVAKMLQIVAKNRSLLKEAPIRLHSTLSAAFIVGDTFRLRGMNPLAGQCQHHQRNDVGQHVVHRARQVQLLQQVKAHVHVAQAAEQAK